MEDGNEKRKPKYEKMETSLPLKYVKVRVDAVRVRRRGSLTILQGCAKSRKGDNRARKLLRRTETAQPTAKTVEGGNKKTKNKCVYK